MKFSNDFDCNGFAKVVREKHLCESHTDIDTILEEARGFFSLDFIAKAADLAQKQFLRKLLRDGFEDEDGEIIRGFKLLIPDPETGEMCEGYKQESFWSLDDYEFMIRDQRRRNKAGHRKFVELCRRAADRFGRREVQARFDFKLPLGRTTA